MRGLVIGLAGLSALVLAAAVAAMPPPPPPLAQPVGDPISGAGATVTLSSSKVGARPVSMTVRIDAPLRCGIPFGSPVVVSLPHASVVPHVIPGSAVLINGKASSKVTVTARSVTVGLPAPHGMTCDSITDGRASLTFTPAARLGNTRTAGTYVVKVRRGSSTYAASVTIS